jgi:hypothetical protein
MLIRALPVKFRFTRLLLHTIIPNSGITRGNEAFTKQLLQGKERQPGSASFEGGKN